MLCVPACVCSQIVHQAVHPTRHAGAAARCQGDGERRPDQRHPEDDLRVQPGGGCHRCGHDAEPGRNTSRSSYSFHTFSTFMHLYVCTCEVSSAI